MSDLETEVNNIETENNNQENVKKKARKFFAKGFRENLKSSNSLADIKEFVQLCTEETKKEDFALEFVENGGSLAEFSRFLDSFEKQNAKEALPIFQAFNIVLLKILSKRPDKLLACEEICREFLVKYYPFIKSMLSLNSTSKQRKVALKLLSTMTTMSATLAKDVLAYASFEHAILEILTNPGTSDDQNSVRTAFIHFLLSFLVEGNTQIISTFLEKKGLLTSIFNGLLYDKYETIDLVLSTIKSKILEDKRMSKTIKMNTFNTHVVKNLVNLYNWKGPLIRKSGNYKKRLTQTEKVDPIEKNKVCNCVHQFLLVLCTSKYGVIFRDPTVGLSGKVHNNLMLTVLQGLGKPWDHQLASELVSKICVVCPDLVKPVLSEVVLVLDPRISKQWLNAIRFVKNLIENLTPDCVGQFFDKLNVRQISLVIQTLCVPKNIVQIVSEKNLLHDYIGVRHEIVKLLYVMCNSVSNYIKYLDKLTTITNLDKMKVKDMMSQYLEQNLPSLAALTQSWNKGTPKSEIMEDPEMPFPNISAHLSIILDILYEYHLICPPIVEDLTNQIDTLTFIKTIQNICTDKNISDEMYVKSINLFLLCDFASFLPSTEIFEYSIPLLLDIYSTNKSAQKNIEKTLFNLIKNTGIFDGCLYEIKIWLYALLEYNAYNENIGNFLMSALRLTYKNLKDYSKEITRIRDSLSEECVFNYKALIETLSMDIYAQNSQDTNSHNILSPLILGVLNTLENSNENGGYVNLALVHLLHAQTAPQVFTTIIFEEKYSNLLDKQLIKYFRRWNDCDALISTKKFYENKNVITKLSKYLIEENDTEVESLFTENSYYQSLLAARVVIFYLTQLSRSKKLTESVQSRCFSSIICLFTQEQNGENFNEMLNIVLKNPLLIQLFSPIQKDDPTQVLCTKFILNVIEKLTELKPKFELESYLNSYRTILIRRIYIMLARCKKHNKPPKNNNIINVVQLLELNSEQCIELLKLCSNLPPESLITSENTISGVTELITYILKRCLDLFIADKNTKLIEIDVMKNIGQLLLYLNKFEVEINFENLEIHLFNYIQQFPHILAAFDEDIYKSILLKPTVSRNSSRLAMQFLKCNPNFFQATSEVLDDIIDKRELIFSLLYAVIDTESPKLDAFIKKVYAKHEQIILKVLNKPQKVAQYLVEYYQIIIKIVQNYISKEICEEFCSKSHKFDVSEIYHYEIITNLFDRCIKMADDKNKYISNLINTTMNYVMNILKRQERTNDENNKMESVLKLFCTYLNKINVIYKFEYSDENLAKSAIFQTFSKSCLKFGLQGFAPLVDVLRRLSEFCPDNDEYIAMLFEMAVSHSETLNIILDNENQTKPFLIQLLYILCKKCPSVMVKTHIPVWLGAYDGSLSTSDQFLLKLMALYENGSVGFNEFKPYLWGKVAVGHYSVKFGVETALWRQPKPGEVLDIFNLDKIKFTITNFPRTRTLNPDQQFYSDSELNVYDPAFFLPLLSQLLAPESTIKWYQCKFGAIALAIIALTSENKDVRIAACHVLARFHNHLEAARYGKDRLLWVHFVEALCRAASTMENLQISSIAGIFMARCAMIFNRPDHSLYSALTNYIMAKERPDISYVPELLELLHSTDVKYVEHRNFILEVMRDGLKSDNDLKIMFRSMAFKFLMDIYNSVVINHEGKRLILEILSSAVTIPSGARILSSTYGLMSWLLSTIKRFGQNDGDLLSTTISLIKNIYLALEADQLQYNKFNILLSLITMIDRFKVIRISLDDIVKFVSILNIVYNIEPKLLTKQNLTDLFSVCVKHLDCHICSYYLEFGNNYIEKPVIENSNEGVYYLKLLTLKWMEVNKTC